jgi:hypothetical protein
VYRDIRARRDKTTNSSLWVENCSKIILIKFRLNTKDIRASHDLAAKALRMVWSPLLQAKIDYLCFSFSFLGVVFGVKEYYNDRMELG